MNWFEHPVFIERVAFLDQSQYWSGERHADYQLFALRHLTAQAMNVPFYRRMMDKEHLGPESIRSLVDLRRFPIIDKKTVQGNMALFLAEGADRNLLLNRTTGGSTGTPLTIWFDGDFHPRNKAITEHYMRVFGLDIFSWRSVRLYGDRIAPEILAEGRYWYVVENRKLVMSCYHIRRESAAAYVAELNMFRPRYIHTRPSSILPLAKYVLEDGLRVNPIRTIVCDGEYLTDGQRRIIEQAFQARLFNVFGHTEACAAGHPCPHSDALHFIPEVGILELLDERGNEVTEPGGRGELVVTGFDNPIMPLIRYRTGDIGYLGEQECRCGRHYKILASIEGRIQDYVIDSAGNPTPLAPAVFNYNDMDWSGIREFKVIQERAGELTIQIAPEAAWAADADSAKAILASRIGGILAGFRIVVEIVDDIPRSAIGKHRYLDQRLDVKDKVSFR